MATGANIQPGRGITVTNLPPSVDLRTGDAEVWDQATRVFDRFADANKADLVRRAQVRGAEEGAAVAAGEMEMPKRGWLFGGDVAAARTAALEQAYTARIRSDIDARDAELRREYRHDPEQYQVKAGEMVSGFIQGSAPEFAVDVESYARARTSDGLTFVANNRAARDEQETVQALGIRAATLQERLIALGGREGGMESAEYRDALLEYSDLQDNRAGNPAVLYSEDQRVSDDDKLFDSIQSANITRLSIEQYRANGGGLGGNAAALRYLQSEVLEGEAFKDVAPERRQRIYRDAVSQLRDFTAVDREEQRIADEQERDRNAARTAAIGEYRLRIFNGDVDRDTILSDPLLDDGQKAGLLSSLQAAERRAAADARRDAALEASESRAIYNEWRDQAATGSLTPAELADAVSAGQISRGQATTLQAMNDRTLRPVIDILLAPTQERARGRRDTSRQIAIAEEASVRFARANPDATLEQRIAAGNAIRDSVFGQQSAGQPSNPQTRQTGTAARVAAANQRIAAARANGRPMSLAEENRIRNEARNGD